jgi:hypothetical protein
MRIWSSSQLRGTLSLMVSHNQVAKTLHLSAEIRRYDECSVWLPRDATNASLGLTGIVDPNSSHLQMF